MFKRKKKKTGIETPEFRKPTPPPPPPTSGSNAQKPRTMIYSMKPEDLKGWVNTKAQIGDIAYYRDRILGHQYIYCYRKPDDNPIWCMIQPELLTDYLQKESEEEREMEYKIDIDAMIKERIDKIVSKSCPYELPCGWCTKWDKKCDKKIGCGNDEKPQRGLRAQSGVYDEAMPRSDAQEVIETIKSGKLPPLKTNDTYGLETRG